MSTKTARPAAKQQSVNGSPPAPDAEVLTLAEAAALLKVTEAGLRQEADAGAIPGRLIAGEWRFVKGAILKWLTTELDVGSPKINQEETTPDRIRKSIPSDPDLNQGFLSSIGVFADDDTLEPMMEQIYRDRKRKR